MSFKVIIALLLLSLSTASMGQFSKYRSKTDLAAPLSKVDTPPSQENSSNSAASVPKNKEDIFGRGTGIKTVKANPKEDKYVTLNPETAFGPEVVTSFDFPNTTLDELTKHMQKLTGLNLIMDGKNLRGKVSIVAPTPITVGDAWKAYLTALNMNGYAIVRSGAFYRIINNRDVRFSPTKIYTGSYTPNTDSYMMRVYPLKYIHAKEVSSKFRNYMSRYGRIIEIEQTNTIILQDTGANINRVVRLISFLDVPGHEATLHIFKVKHSSAQEIATLLDKILKGQTKSSSRSRRSRSKSPASGNIQIIAEPRTNSLIAMVNSEDAKRLRSLIKKLDVTQRTSGTGQIHVYYLNYGDAETLAKTLSSLVSGSTKSSSSRSSRSRFSSSNQAASLFSAAVKVTSDKSNNALVVTASPTDYLTIKEVIKKLDIPRDQVYVEGLIMETNVNKNRGFGISILGAYDSGGAQRFGFGDSTDLANLISGNFTSLSGLFVGGAAGRSVTYTDPSSGKAVSINSVNGLIKAIATNSNNNVLATPQILALDNTEAVFEVGETVPTPEKTNAANGASSFSVKPQKVALTLKLTPQINKVTRFVKLNINQKIDDFSKRSLPQGLAESGVATTTRSAVTTVVVRDRDTIAMGGLMRDQETVTESKVPLLGDIPLLGWLFKSKSQEVSKVNLLFFLTPKILAPYEKVASRTTKDLIVRRHAHLKPVFGKEDPHQSTAKGLFEKAKAQEKQALYDLDEASQYLNRNKEPSIGPTSEGDGEEKDENDLDETMQELNEQAKIPAAMIPNYSEILQAVNEKKSAPKRN